MSLSIRAMTSCDIPLGMRLKDQAGWNQIPADWRRFLDLEPEGCFVALWEDRPVATTTTCTFGAVGWIAMGGSSTSPIATGESPARWSHERSTTWRRDQSLPCVSTPPASVVRSNERIGFVAQGEFRPHARDRPGWQACYARRSGPRSGRSPVAGGPRPRGHSHGPPTSSRTLDD